MKTLAEHNKQRTEQNDALRTMQEPHANGAWDNEQPNDGGQRSA